MSKPTIVCVPGAWHTPEIYQATFNHLAEYGYQTVGVPLACIKANPPRGNYDDDVKGIRDVLVGLIEGEGKDAVLVLHSYGGMCGGDASFGLGKLEREQRGLKGGIVRLCYASALAMPAGFAPPEPYPDWVHFDWENGFAMPDLNAVRTIFYNDLSDDDAAKWIAKLQPQSTTAWGPKTTCSAWLHIPSTYIKAGKDSTFSTDFVDWMIGNARAENPNAFDVVEECQDAGHCVMLNHPAWLAEVLRRAAGESI